MAQLEYDETGGTSLYFITSFVGLVLIPCTYLFWPYGPSYDGDIAKDRACHCEPCELKKNRLHRKKPFSKFRQRLTKTLVLVGWIVFIYLVYLAAQVERDHVEYDPFEVLGVERGASEADIKRQYRKLSLKFHPDREGGDEKMFMRIAKAHAALTDEEARENWEKYGNPDGPQATSFGIALPSWIVEKENSIWVLGAYVFAFMIIMPLVVGTWWYKSIRYSGDKILLGTTHLFMYFINKTPNMNMKRALMVLAAACEFDCRQNPDVGRIRATDETELMKLMRALPNLGAKNKEMPLCLPYSIKARALIHCHLSRIDLPQNTFDMDKNYILLRCPSLILEMINCASQLIAMHRAGRVSSCPKLGTMESIMKLSQLIVQGLWEHQSSLFQLPHFTSEVLHSCSSKRRHIHAVAQLAKMSDTNRRTALRVLTDTEYNNVINVMSTMPFIDMDVKSEVLDDEDNCIVCAGDIVTVTITLTRSSMEDLFNQESSEINPDKDADLDKSETANQNGEIANNVKLDKTRVWEKQKKGKKGKGKKKHKPPVQNKKQQKPETLPSDATENKSNTSEEKKSKCSKEKTTMTSSGEDSDSDGGEHSASDNNDNNQDNNADDSEDDNKSHSDVEDDWESLQANMSKRGKVLEPKVKISHEVHCPHFPEVKQEWWWLYICDRKNQAIITPPFHVVNLKVTEEVRLQLVAPQKPGRYQYTVCLRSDSYVDFSISRAIKLDVNEARKMEDNHPQWDISEDEDNLHSDDDNDSNSDLTTDDDDSD